MYDGMCVRMVLSWGLVGGCEGKGCAVYVYYFEDNTLAGVRV